MAWSRLRAFEPGRGLASAARREPSWISVSGKICRGGRRTSSVESLGFSLRTSPPQRRVAPPGVINHAVIPFASAMGTVRTLRARRSSARGLGVVSDKGSSRGLMLPGGALLADGGNPGRGARVLRECRRKQLPRGGPFTNEGADCSEVAQTSDGIRRASMPGRGR